MSTGHLAVTMPKLVKNDVGAIQLIDRDRPCRAVLTGDLVAGRAFHLACNGW
jgi:hypothetical protein